MIIFGSQAHYSAIGGVENSIRNLLKVAMDRSQPVTLVCREALLNESLDASAAVLPNGVVLHTYRNEGEINLFRRLRFLSVGGERVSTLYRRLYNGNPTARVIVRHHAHTLAAYSAGFRDIRYLVPSLTVRQLSAELMGSSLRQKCTLLARMWIDGWAQKRGLTRASLFVFSVSMKRDVSRYLPTTYQHKNICVVKPGIDQTRFYPATLEERSLLRARLKLPPEKNLLLFVGRFSQGKGIAYFLQALQILLDDYIAVLVGEGDRQLTFRHHVESEGLASRVVFAGATSRVDDYYRACNLFVMPTITESFGQTFIEAAACELPIVAFHRATGVVTATHEMGLDMAIEYATELNSEALAEAVLKAMTLIPKGGLEMVSDYVHRCYRWEVLLEQLLD